MTFYTMLGQRQRRWAGVNTNVIHMFCVCWDAIYQSSFVHPYLKHSLINDLLFVTHVEIYFQ